MKVDESEVGNNLLANLTRFGNHSGTNHSTSCCHQPKGCFPSAESYPFYCRATLKGTLFQQHKPCKANVKGDNCKSQLCSMFNEQTCSRFTWLFVCHHAQNIFEKPYTAIFLKSPRPKDIKTDIPNCQIHKHTNTNTNTQIQLR